MVHAVYYVDLDEALITGPCYPCASFDVLYVKAVEVVGETVEAAAEVEKADTES